MLSTTSLAGKTIQWSKVTSTNAIVSQLEIPPGKYYPFHTDDPLRKMANLLLLTEISRSNSGATSMEICSIPAL